MEANKGDRREEEPEPLEKYLYQTIHLHKHSAVYVTEIPHVVNPLHGVVGRGMCSGLSRVLKKMRVGMRLLA